MKAMDIHRLYDIAEAIDILLTYHTGKPDDIPRWSTTLRYLQIIGEASQKLTEPTKQLAPQIPWDNIIATRHILVHEYGSVNTTIINSVVEEHIPTLQHAIHHLITILDPDAKYQ